MSARNTVWRTPRPRAAWPAWTASAVSPRRPATTDATARAAPPGSSSGAGRPAGWRRPVSGTAAGIALGSLAAPSALSVSGAAAVPVLIGAGAVDTAVTILLAACAGWDHGAFHGGLILVVITDSEGPQPVLSE